MVVDRKMMDNHGHKNITTYVLTVLNMVREIGLCVNMSVSTYYDMIMSKYQNIFNMLTSANMCVGCKDANFMHVLNLKDWYLVGAGN